MEIGKPASDSLTDSVRNLVSNSVKKLVNSSVNELVMDSIYLPVWFLVSGSVRNSVCNIIRLSVRTKLNGNR